MLRIAASTTLKRCSAVVSTTALGTIVYTQSPLSSSQSKPNWCSKNIDSISYCSWTQPLDSSSLRLQNENDQVINNKDEKERTKNNNNGTEGGDNALLDQGDVDIMLNQIRPIAQASLRAMRLVTTVVMIVLEYKMDYYKLRMNEVIVSSGYDGILGKINNNDLKRQKLEENVQNKLKELQEAQRKYANPVKDKEGDEREDMRTAVHVAAEKLGQSEQELLEFMEAEATSSTVHARAAKRLRDLCRVNGGTYIKVGQHVANLDHLLPPDYINTLQSLFSNCPTTSYDDVREVVREELGNYPEAIFESFEKEPIASASLAQVHVATEKGTGRKLAVKVQHRGLKETSRGDLLALETVVRLVDHLFDEFKWGWIVDEIAPNVSTRYLYNENMGATLLTDTLI